MDKELVDYVIEKSKDLMAAPSACKEVKEAAQKWIDSVGTENEVEETKKYIEELENDITTIDNLIGLVESDMGVQIFGEERAKNMAVHAKEIKAAGAEYCDCPACSAAEAILKRKDELLKN